MARTCSSKEPRTRKGHRAPERDTMRVHDLFETMGFDVTISTSEMPKQTNLITWTRSNSIEQSSNGPQIDISC